MRGVTGNFFPTLKKQAMQVPVGSGMEIIQSFEPILLYEVMEQLGCERQTEKAAENEYHVYFYRTEMKQDSGDIPMRPAALTNFPMIDNDLAEIAVNFWEMTTNCVAPRMKGYQYRMFTTGAVGVPGCPPHRRGRDRI